MYDFDDPPAAPSAPISSTGCWHGNPILQPAPATHDLLDRDAGEPVDAVAITIRLRRTTLVATKDEKGERQGNRTYGSCRVRDV